MGIKQLWGFLRDAGVLQDFESSPAELAALLDGKAVAIDSAAWISQAEQQLALLEHFTIEEAAVKVCFERALHFLRFGVTPVFVVEGVAPPEKGRSASGTAAFVQRCRNAARVLEALGFPVIRAPGEGEATCAALLAAGVVDFIASFDSDSLAYEGAEAVFKELRLSATAERTTSATLCRMDSLRALLCLDPGYGHRAFALLAGLVGCDYDQQGAERVGNVGALAVVRQLTASGNDTTVMEDFARLLERRPNHHLLSLQQCTGCSCCGHESGRKGRIKRHTASNPCPLCPPSTNEATGCTSIEGPCQCPFHKFAEERKAERLLQQARTDTGLLARLSHSTAVFERQGAEATAFVNQELRRRGIAPGQRLQWSARPDVEGVHAVLSSVASNSLLSWDYSLVRSKTLPALLEFDLRAGPGAHGAEFRPTMIKKVHGNGEGIEDGISRGNGGVWRYLLEWERLEVADESDVGLREMWPRQKSSTIEAANAGEEERGRGRDKSHTVVAGFTEGNTLSVAEFDRQWLAAGANRGHRASRQSEVRRRWPDLEAAFLAKMETPRKAPGKSAMKAAKDVQTPGITDSMARRPAGSVQTDIGKYFRRSRKGIASKSTANAILAQPPAQVPWHESVPATASRQDSAPATVAKISFQAPATAVQESPPKKQRTVVPPTPSSIATPLHDQLEVLKRMVETRRAREAAANEPKLQPKQRGLLGVRQRAVEMQRAFLEAASESQAGPCRGESDEKVVDLCTTPPGVQSGEAFMVSSVEKAQARHIKERREHADKTLMSTHTDDVIDLTGE